LPHIAFACLVTAIADGFLAVTLSGFEPQINSFTDRPGLGAGITAAADFCDSCESLFIDSVPNSVLVEHLSEVSTDHLVATIHSPRLTDDGPQVRAVLLEGEQLPERLKQLIGKTHEETSTAFGVATLLIDSVGTCPRDPKCLG
jgi:hypothetical protein